MSTTTPKSKVTIASLLQSLEFLKEHAQTPQEHAVIRDHIMIRILAYARSDRIMTEKRFISWVQPIILSKLAEFRKKETELLVSQLALVKRVSDHEIFPKFQYLDFMCKGITQLATAPFQEIKVPNVRQQKYFENEIVSLITSTIDVSIECHPTINDTINDIMIHVIDRYIGDNEFKKTFTSDDEFIISSALYIILVDALSDVKKNLMSKRKVN